MSEHIVPQTAQDAQQSVSFGKKADLNPLSRLFRVLDSDLDGFLSWNEFLCMHNREAESGTCWNVNDPWSLFNDPLECPSARAEFQFWPHGTDTACLDAFRAFLKSTCPINAAGQCESLDENVQTQSGTESETQNDAESNAQSKQGDTQKNKPAGNEGQSQKRTWQPRQSLRFLQQKFATNADAEPQEQPTQRKGNDTAPIKIAIKIRD